MTKVEMRIRMKMDRRRRLVRREMTTIAAEMIMLYERWKRRLSYEICLAVWQRLISTGTNETIIQFLRWLNILMWKEGRKEERKEGKRS